MANHLTSFLELIAGLISLYNSEISVTCNLNNSLIIIKTFKDDFCVYVIMTLLLCIICVTMSCVFFPVSFIVMYAATAIRDASLVDKLQVASVQLQLVAAVGYIARLHSNSYIIKGLGNRKI